MKKQQRPRWVKRPSQKTDKSVGVGIVPLGFEKASLVLPSFSIKPGSSVSFATVVAAAGGLYGRVMNTKVWMKMDLVEEFSNPELLRGAMEQRVLAPSAKKVNQSLKKDKVSSIVEKGWMTAPEASEASHLTQKINKPTKTLSEKSNVTSIKTTGKNKDSAMDKTVLKETLIHLNNNDYIGEQITLNFRGPKANLSGDYRLLEVRKWKGKGGSMIAKLESVDGMARQVAIGTKNSDEILNLSYMDKESKTNVFMGYREEREVPVGLGRDIDKAKVLRNSFLPFIGKIGLTLRVNSTEPSFQGEYTLLNAVKTAGRFGQVCLSLKRVSDGEALSIWSYRHSGVVESVEVLDDTNLAD